MRKLSPRGIDQRLTCHRCGGALYKSNASIHHGKTFGRDCGRAIRRLERKKTENSYTLEACAVCNKSFRRPTREFLPEVCYKVDCACCVHSLHCLLLEREKSGTIPQDMFLDGGQDAP